MTNSEFKCTNELIDYFLREFVYRDLYFYEGKQEKELCDGLVEFQDAYIVFQIKEKRESKSTKWLQKKVYKDAVAQIKDTIKMIKSENIIEVESYTGERIVLDAQKKIFPVIVFDSEDQNYKQIHTSSKNRDFRINVFSMTDFCMVLESIAIPHDIITYLEMRSTFFESKLPHIFINEIDDNLTTVAKIGNDEGLVEYFFALTNGNKHIDSNAIKGFQCVIKMFQERLLEGQQYNKEEYKRILKELLKFNRNTVHDFMLRWHICVEHCVKKEETMSHFLIEASGTVGCLYITETALKKETAYVEFLLQLFKYKFDLTTAIGVVFNGIDEENYVVEWFLQSFENSYNEQFEKILEEEKLWSNAKKIELF